MNQKEMRISLNKIVVITGGIGSGKTSISKIFLNLGVPVIDFDQIVREITFSEFFLGYFKKKFGRKVIKENGFLDKGRLRIIFFRNEKIRKTIENLIHPIVFRIAYFKWKLLSYHPYCIWVIPLFFEKKLEKFFNKVLIVDVCHTKLQLERVIERDKISQYEVEWFISNQICRKDRLNKKKTAEVIENNSLYDLNSLKDLVLEKHIQILKSMKKN
ncbi:dephospho-CoA kinase [Candidatus Riesia pediculicola USDA]|uniref:Dephospho-CoA kinase n=2 Tax=Candidatus Riesia pediculicola TaxID=401619 RepID=D4G8D4_RIEPU|nr:dephospho-CoA kinase [Candidatus Riesia pediculicola USDA]